ncbi:hypothetical protein EIP91_009787 [Steccherinum ochraceum]|uniref:Uncharacterized protein n=1 Tax=Steccherinum ochraceum TaxID=92696 RepID=A0A4R0RZN6_9APHY|nr:hypothetical protein EIP91_009787 [Steccherinum ochraceum]
MNLDNDHSQSKLALFALVIGILYIVTTGICVFGVVAASIQKEKIVKLFAFASIGAAICVCGGGFLRVIVHFIHKNDLISECESVVTGTGVTFRFGIWGPRVHDNLDPEQAAEFCKDGWNHDSASEIISLIVEIILSVFFVFVAFGYIKQVKQSKKERKHAMATAGDFEDGEVSAGYPTYYNPPYLGYDAAGASYGGYAPPPGPPPNRSMDPEESSYNKLEDPFADFESVKKQPDHQKRDSKDTLV